ncbi:MAG: c-type cytochrome [Tsuneonella sp.]
MSSPFRASLAAALVLLAGACDREERNARGRPLPETGPLIDTVSLRTVHDPRADDYKNNAEAVSQGQLYFAWMNCSGCHANGGGGIGPALIDDEWRYGSSMSDIAETIAHGRPNGMPAFAGKLTPQQIWQLAAYVRSLSALDRQDVRSGRSEGVSTGEPGTLRDPKQPITVTPKQDEATVR